MKINRDDPRWTAYVLGELDSRERSAVEQLLESSEDAREFVEELRLASAMLKDEMASMPAAGLEPEHREKIRRAAAPVVVRPWWSGRPRVVWATGALAASLVVLLVAPTVWRSRESTRTDSFTALPQHRQVTPGDAVMPELAAPSVNRSQEAPGLTTPQPQEELSNALNVEVAVDPAVITQQKVAVAQAAQDAVAPAAPPPSPSSLRENQAFVERRAEVSGVGNRVVGPGSGGGIRGVLGGVYPGPAAAERQAVAAVPIADRANIARPNFNTEAYDRITDNPFLAVSQNPLSTFSIDVDTASYANVRRFLMQNQLPPRDAVRIEELVNYFKYDYAQPSRQHPIGAQMEVASAPWNPQHRLVRIGIKGRDMDAAARPSSNLVFLIDVSGSMQPAAKLPLLKSAMKLLVDRLTENDRVSIVVYAGASGLALPPTTGDKKEIIMRAIDELRAGGSTNGASGIRLAYDLAVQNFVRGGVNRVILATDGDFNVGVTNQGDLIRLIEEKARSGVFLSVFGFGMGNLKDSTLEKLADSGNGNYAYIDTINEARKVLVEEAGSTLVTIAKDVKIQIEFNPARVGAYRLIGYENRLLRNEDFNNDQKDAGDMGAGHTVTALYEIVPAGVGIPTPGVDPLKYQTAAAPNRAASNGEMLTLKVRYKEADAAESKLFESVLVDRGSAFANASQDFRFAASVAAFGMVLRDSPYKGNVSMDDIIGMAQQSSGADRGGYREEFINLVRRARALNELKQ